MARNTRRYMPVMDRGRVKLLQAAKYNSRRKRKMELMLAKSQAPQVLPASRTCKKASLYEGLKAEKHKDK